MGPAKFLDETSSSIMPSKFALVRTFRQGWNRRALRRFSLRERSNLGCRRNFAAVLQTIETPHILNSLVLTLIVLLDRLTAWWAGPSAAMSSGSAGQAPRVDTLVPGSEAFAAPAKGRRHSFLGVRKFVCSVVMNSSGWRRTNARPERRCRDDRPSALWHYADLLAQRRAEFLRLYSPSVILSR